MKAPFLKNAKYRKQQYAAGDIVPIREEDIDDLIEDGIINEDDIIEGYDETEKSLDQCSLAELKAYAEKHNIDVGDAKRKKQLLELIQAHQAAAGGNGNGNVPE